jgi:DNA primase
VIILADNDKPGLDHANRVAAELLSVVKSVRVVVFAELPPHADVSDFFDNGGTPGDLLSRVAEAPQCRAIAPRWVIWHN